MSDFYLQDEVNLFLDRIRESGAINMFGAAPYVQEAFGISKKEAKELLLNWMDTFDQRHPLK
jgi:hypothetical protein